MEFQVARNPFLKALYRVQSLVDRHNIKPILSNALLETQEGYLKIEATNLEVSLRTRCAVDIIEPGSITINAKTLFEVVSELPETEMVVLRTDARGRVRLSCGRAKFELACLPSEQFPVIPQADGAYRFVLDPALLSEMLAKTHFAMSEDETRYALNGVFFQVVPFAGEGEGEGMIRVVATDSHRLAMVQRSVAALPAEAREVIVPRKAVQEVRRLLEEDAQPVEVIVDDNYIQMVRPEVMLVAKLVEGRFPDYRRVIPQQHPLHLMVNREQLLRVVRRMSALSHEKSTGIRLEIEGGQMRFNSNNPEQEEAEEEMQVSLEGGDTLMVGFNARYLREFLSVMEGEDVSFFMSSEAAPVLLTDPLQRGTQFVLMPMST
ncbi:MAG: DNA polymerase III subunit beta [Magnetococcales bacterium]|nr:DNA polymerase III subunit beta [Magnetococcales bacterium]